MYYQSTRNSDLRVSSAEAIVSGISKDGGLFAPSEIPSVSLEELKRLGEVGYTERAQAVFSKFLTDFTADEIKNCVESAYSSGSFETENVMELKELERGVNILELWHGPTCAFKDMALQILPHLLTTSVKKAGVDKKVCILVATSGDTGKAALEGFKDAPGTEILVFYPENGVSAMQKLQMTTQEGKNVGVCAIKGNFDDAQTGVKKIFTDPEVAKVLSDNGIMFSSANSINWGRLAPQIVYYVSSYAQLVHGGKIALGEEINIVVPTGNFGNILAAYYAKLMGVPVKKLICASNSNNVLTDFLRTGVYDRNRRFYTTISPSMDILVSSNLERLLWHLCGKDSEYISGLFAELSKSGRFEVSEDIKKALKELFSADFCTEDETKAAIAEVNKKYGYTVDTHTAVAVGAYKKYVRATGDKTTAVIASTASPYKFPAAVLEALGAKGDYRDEFEMADKLCEISGMKIPRALSELKNKKPRFTGSVEKSEMLEAVYSLLKIK